MCWFSIEFPWLRLLYGVSYFLVQLVPVCGASVSRYSGIQQYWERSVVWNGARAFRFLQLGDFGILMLTSRMFVSFSRVDRCAFVDCLVDQAGYRESSEGSRKVLQCAEADPLESGA